jgi:hypothetical protein
MELKKVLQIGRFGKAMEVELAKTDGRRELIRLKRSEGNFAAGRLQAMSCLTCENKNFCSIYVQTEF